MLASSSVSSSPITSNPFAQMVNQASDMTTFMNRAQSSSDFPTKLEIYKQIIMNLPVNQEMSRFYTTLLADIFGLGNLPGWRLHSLNRKSPKDEALFKIINEFMAPDGNLFGLIEKLQFENVAYEFPSTLLPNSVQDQIQQNFLSVTNSAGNGVVPGAHGLISQTLSALEYFLVMFFGYILQPKIQKEPIDWSGDVLFVSLFETYLAYFLPLSGRKQYSFDSQPQSLSGSFFPRQENSLRLLPRNSNERYATIPVHGDSGVYSRDSRSIIMHGGLRSSHQVHRKSEIFIEVLKSLWLGYEHLESQDYYYLPGADQVTMIRTFIKHMHHFLSEATPTDNNEISPSSTSRSQQDELKRLILPMVQKKLYNFFKNCFLHWPLDESFKVVRETWLSYIQPWRYQDSVGVESLVSLDKWFGFIEDNLVFYTALFRMFTKRAARLDLQLHRDVQFIFRVTKVFSNLNLPQLLQRADNAALLSSSHLGLNPMTYSRFGSSYMSLRSSPRSTTRLEDAPFESLFDQDYVQNMQELASVLFNKAGAIRKESASQRLTGKSDQNFIGGIKALFAHKSDVDDDSDDRELEAKLIKASNQLAAIFDFDPPKSTESPGEVVSPGEVGQLPKPFISDKCYEDGRLLPEHVIESDGTVTLTDRGRFQILQKLRYFNIQGKSSTELEPVKSYEIPTLVRLLYKVTTRLNEKCEEPLKILYNRNDVIGKALRTLSPKVLQFNGISVKLPANERTGTIQPRVCLRYLASYYTLYYIFWLFVIFKIFNVGTLQCIVILILLFLLFTLQNVISTPVKLRKE